jgi:hypothetical protein
LAAGLELLERADAGMQRAQGTRVHVIEHVLAETWNGEVLGNNVNSQFCIARTQATPQGKQDRRLRGGDTTVNN